MSLTLPFLPYLQERQHARLPWPFQRVTSWRYRDGSFVENCRVGVFFFVFVRLICAVVSLLMAVRRLDR
jgi:hypothetical protein